MLAFDLKRRETKRQREGFSRVRKAERHYTLQLRKVARHIGDIVGAFDPLDPKAVALIRAALERYSELLEPWAKAVGAQMLADVSRRDERVWASLSDMMGTVMRHEVRRAPTGAQMQKLLAEQVHYITSLPLDAAQRVQKLSQEALFTAARPAEIAKEIMRSGEVSRARADLIARTEVGRASSTLTQTRAQSIGCTGYIWRTAGDSEVRPLHRRLNGKFFTWENPPVTGEAGERSLPGAIYNCRCYAEPVIPRENMR